MQLSRSKLKQPHVQKVMKKINVEKKDYNLSRAERTKSGFWYIKYVI